MNNISILPVTEISRSDIEYFFMCIDMPSPRVEEYVINRIVKLGQCTKLIQHIIFYNDLKGYLSCLLESNQVSHESFCEMQKFLDKFYGVNFH